MSVHERKQKLLVYMREIDAKLNICFFRYYIQSLLHEVDAVFSCNPGDHT